MELKRYFGQMTFLTKMKVIGVVSLGVILSSLPAASFHQLTVFFQILALGFIVFAPGNIGELLCKINTYHHELAHGLACLLSGGEFIDFCIHKTGGGVCKSRGGNRTAINVSGYLSVIALGSILIFKAVYGLTANTLELSIFSCGYLLSTSKARDTHTKNIGFGLALAFFVGGLLNWSLQTPLPSLFLFCFLGSSLLLKGISSMRNLIHFSLDSPENTSDAQAMREIYGGEPLSWSIGFALAAFSGAISVFAMLYKAIV